MLQNYIDDNGGSEQLTWLGVWSSNMLRDHQLGDPSVEFIMKLIKNGSDQPCGMKFHQQTVLWKHFGPNWICFKFPMVFSLGSGSSTVVNLYPDAVDYSSIIENGCVEKSP